MTIPADDRLRRAVRPLIVVVLAAQVLRILGAVVGTLSDIAQRHSEVPPSFGLRESVGPRLIDFGQAGDEVGALMLLAAVVLLWATARAAAAAGSHDVARWRRPAFGAVWLLILTALGAALVLAGYLVDAGNGGGGYPIGIVISVVGRTAAVVAMCVAGIYVTRRLTYLVDETAQADVEVGLAGGPAAVFAVDRRNGDVLAWATVAKAVAEAPVFGVEDDEYEFFFDDGTVLSAGVVDGRVQFTPTDVERSDALVAALQAFALRTRIQVDPADADEPLAYVDPISRTHWLDLWPAWTRWIGRIARPPR